MALEPTPEELDEMDQYADVLADAHAILTSVEGITFGEALRRAVEMADVHVPEEMQKVMLAALARVVFQGFPSDIEA